jgi:hypothetical protein
VTLHAPKNDAGARRAPSSAWSQEKRDRPPGWHPVVTVAGQSAPLTPDPHTATPVTVTIPATPATGPITLKNGSVTVRSAGDFTINAPPVASDSPQFVAAVRKATS